MPRVTFNINTAGSLLRRIVPPVLPPLPVPYNIATEPLSGKQLNDGSKAIGEQFFPLEMSFGETSGYWRLPDEPMISIEGNNTIVRRSVAKAGAKYDVRGTVKERWAQDDYRITISGLLYNLDDANVYPENDVKNLKNFCEAKQAIYVICPLFEYFGIAQMVIESYSIPFTSGENSQAYSITAYSDALFELLIDTKEQSNV